MNNVPLYINIPFLMLEEHLERIREHSLNVEIYFDNNTLEEVGKGQILRVRKELQRREMRCTVHAPYKDISLGAFDKDVKVLAIEKIKKSVEITQILSASFLVIHTGYDERIYGDEKDQWMERFKKSLQEILAEKDHGTFILLENVFEEDPSIFLDVFSSFTNLGLCFDTGHFNVFSKTPLYVWLTSMKEKIKEIHIHDNFGFKDEHVPVGKGNFSFISLKDFVRKENMIFTLEVLDPNVALDAVERGKRLVLKWLTE